MKLKRAAVAAIAVTALAVIGGGAAYAASSSTGQPSGPVVYACVGSVDSSHSYYQFRAPVPHACQAGYTLWQLAAPGSGGGAPDVDGFIPSSVQAGHSGSDSGMNTSFTLTDNSKSPVVVWTCTLSAPVTNPGAPGISCSHLAAAAAAGALLAAVQAAPLPTHCVYHFGSHGWLEPWWCPKQ